MSKADRKRISAHRKSALIESHHNYNDLARLADISYSMAEKWMNARRNSAECERAFSTLTGQPATPETVAA